MASRGRYGEGPSQLRSWRRHSIKEAPLFNRVLNAETLLLRKLSLPVEFVARHRTTLLTLSTRVILKVCNGDPWQIGLKDHAGTKWFCKGWGKFVKKYSLKEKYSLFFRYEGNSVFHVTILEDTGVEIKYPTRRVNGGRRMEVGSDESYGDASGYDESANLSREMRRKVRNPPRPIGNGALRWGRTRGSGSAALNLANQFPTKNPSFQVLLCDWYMRSGGMSICSDFMIKNGLTKDVEVMILKISGSRRSESWAVKMYTYKTERRGKLCAGWAKFLGDNDLKAGDVCVFELLSKIDFLVHIFRGP